MAKPGALSLPVVQEEEELTAGDVFVHSSGQTPTAKRQRRLTLTAMTGLICELAKESSGEDASASEAGQRREVVDSESMLSIPSLSQHTDMVEVESSVPSKREASPLRRLKRARASISATATAEVMAAQAARTLTASRSKPCSRSCARENSSESSDSTEEEEDSLAVRVRHAQAFELGAQAVTESAASDERQTLHAKERDLSPGSKKAFSQGVRAAQVAAKVAAKMASQATEPAMAQRSVGLSMSSTRKSGPEVPSLSFQLRGGA
jgi:hypothetical protein